MAGAVVSMRMVCDFQPESQPALSNTRVLRMWVPSPLTVTVVEAPSAIVGVVAVSSSYSTCSMPEVASVPVTVTFSGPVCQPGVAYVVSVGTSVSILTCWVFQAVHVPEPSVTRVLSRWSPSAAIVTVLLFGPLPVTAPLSTSHWTVWMPAPPVSVPLTVMTWGEVLLQPDATVVESCGPVRSTWSVWLAQMDGLPATSTIRVESVCVPSGIEMLEWFGPVLAMLAPSSFHSTWSTPEPASVPLRSMVVGVYCQPIG